MNLLFGFAIGSFLFRLWAHFYSPEHADDRVMLFWGGMLIGLIAGYVFGRTPKPVKDFE